MVAALTEKIYSPEEYLAIERSSPVKSEYLYGEIFAMAGGSPQHSTIGINITISIGTQLKGKQCQAFSNDMKVSADISGSYLYPDLSVVCDEPLFHDEERDVLLNPTLVIEVLSPSTEAHDRGKKWAQYQKIDSVQNYLMISQDEPRLELYVRQPDDKWLLTVVKGLSASLALPAIGCDLLLAEVYDRVKFPGPGEVRLGTPPNEE